jgi:hypothetical protein
MESRPLIDRVAASAGINVLIGSERIPGLRFFMILKASRPELRIAPVGNITMILETRR